MPDHWHVALVKVLCYGVEQPGRAGRLASSSSSWQQGRRADIDAIEEGAARERRASDASVVPALRGCLRQRPASGRQSSSLSARRQLQCGPTHSCIISLTGSSFCRSVTFRPGKATCSGGGCNSGGFHTLLYQSVQLGMVKSGSSFRQEQLGSALGQYPARMQGPGRGCSGLQQMARYACH